VANRGDDGTGNGDDCAASMGSALGRAGVGVILSTMLASNASSSVTVTII